ncbi:TRAP transporter small permease subunit [Prosthecochloris sp. HL-130-GSB]|jgi:TRAP-type mannitol/chloroaromatic compound transport system permease small subunit|uniref:TRAP transporter small permease subunit n=1 Tax=Prosthecochloris sp. HL-130-GSB TaxID=1974213 RepID=UPI000A1C12AD|nr:TRAP transporter small permease subunit [Prosthecochloris sp. HL-130-GSB]ARM30299.1 C4-dicarboxylate ABC transporter permease [Prosthecochloris sp. HL-130-GSB]
MQVLKSLIGRIEACIAFSGRIVSWMTLLLVLVVVYDVFTRYVLSASSVAVQELEWHLFALIFLLAAAVTLQKDKHVRVDVLYSRFSEKQKALVTIAGTILFLVPFCVAVIISSMPFVQNSWMILESSPDPGGLPYRFLLKAAIPVGFFLVLLQGVASFLRAVLVLVGNPVNSTSQP